MNFGQYQAAASAYVGGEQINQRLQLQQEEIEQQKQQTQAMQMSNMMKQQQAQAQAQTQNWLNQNLNNQDMQAKSPEFQAKVFSQGATEALKNGDYKGAEELSDLAKGKMTEAKQARLEQAAAKAEATDGLAKQAMLTEGDPSEDNLRALQQAAANAGQDPTKIPQPGTPQFKTYLESVKVGGMGMKDILAAKEKKQEFEEKRQDAVEKAKAEQELRLMEIKERAEARRQSLELQKEGLALRELLVKSTLQQRAEKSEAAATGTTAVDQRQARAIVGFAGEAVRGLDLLGEMATGQTQGTFASLDKPDTILKALTNVGANKATPQNQQLMQTTLKGLGMEIANVAALGTGRAPTESVKKTFTDMLAAQPGDTNLHTVYRIVNAADVIRQRLKTTIKVTDPKVGAQQEEIEKQLQKYPSPSRILSLARQQGVDLKAEQKKGQLLRTTLDSIAAGGDGSEGSGAAKGSVARPAEINDIMKNLGF